MSSLLTNTGAMVALQTLRSINQNMAQTQSEISTGKSIANARDNAAMWSITKTMESDVRGFTAISESLALGRASVGVARTAAETTTKLLTQMKGLIVSAQGENVDRGKIQTDINNLREQIGAVVGAAQFNGLNLVDGSSTRAVNVLSSLNRSASGAVTAGQIEVGRQNLSVTGQVTSAAMGTDAIGTPTDFFDAAGVTVETGDLDAVADWTSAGSGVTVAAGGTLDLNIAQVTAGTTFKIVLSDVNVNVVGGGSTPGTREFTFVAGASDGIANVGDELARQMNSFFAAATSPTSGGTPSYSVAAALDSATNQMVLTITNNTGDAIDVGIGVSGGGTAGTTLAEGGLGLLQTVDVTSNSGAAAAMSLIDGMIDIATSAAASFGSAQARIDTQAEFVKNLTASLNEGIGSLVDADMEATSARLQALQVQQQLATQALSIANQQPQNILALFR